MKKNKQFSDYISIAEFSKRYGIKTQTVMKNLEKIHGVVLVEDEIKIKNSARYPYNMRRTRTKDRAEKMYIFLRATREFFYIDSKMLNMSSYSFMTMVKEMCSLGLIVDNKSGNKDGANAYDTTAMAENYLKQSKTKAIRALLELTANTSGVFVGAMLSQMNNG